MLGFPYIFRGALDVRATTINMEMKIAAARALAELAREDVPDEVVAVYGTRLKFGPDYIIPVPFDPRLISSVPPAVAKAAMDSGVARKPIVDMDAYARPAALAPRSGRQHRQPRVRARCAARPSAWCSPRARRSRSSARRRASCTRGSAPRCWSDARIACKPPPRMPASSSHDGIEIINARLSSRNAAYAAYLYERLQRKGFLQRDCQRLINQDRNHFAACMVALDDADAHGDRRHPQLLRRARRRHPLHRRQARPPRDRRLARAGARAHRAGRRHRHARNADAETHRRHRRRGRRRSRASSATSRGWRCSPSPPSAIRPGERAAQVQEAVRILDQRRVDFEYDGEMAADVALNPDLMAAYPFCRLSGPANVLVMPAFHSAAISTKMLQELGGATVIGPLLVGLDRPVQIVNLSATDTDLVNMAAFAAFNVSG